MVKYCLFIPFYPGEAMLPTDACKSSIKTCHLDSEFRPHEASRLARKF